MINIQKEIDKGHATQVMTWPTYDDSGPLPRHKFVTSSEVGKCARMVRFSKDAGPQPHQTLPNWGYAERGNIIEEWAVKMLRLAGVELEYAGTDQRSFYTGVQSGTPDGVAPYGKCLWAYEFKSIDPRKRVSDLPNEAHVKQLHQNMDLMETCLDKVVLGGSLFYINASNLQQTYQFNVGADHALWAELQARAEWIMAAESPAALPPEGMSTSDCDYCGFTEQCSRIVGEGLTGLQNAGNGVFK